MEVLIGIAFVLVFGWVISFVFKSITRGGKAVIDTAKGQGTLGENLSANFSGIPNTTFRIADDVLTLENGAKVEVFRFEMRGLIPRGPNNRSSEVTVAISLLDAESKLPLMCLLDEFQETQTRFFLSTRPLGFVPLDSGFTSFTTVGFAIKDTLIPAKSGNRRLRALFRFMNSGIETAIYQSRLEDTAHLYEAYVYPNPSYQSSVILNFESPGYVEIGEDAELAQICAIKLAVGLAMVDGELHEKEGNVIKNWVQKYVEDFEGERREEIKSRMNIAMEAAYKEVTTTGIDRDDILQELKNVGQKIDYYETLELLMDIMAADDEAHVHELEFLNYAGVELGVSTREIQNMKDVRVLDNDRMVVTENNAEQILGIDPSKMSKSEICDKLTNEFIIWNSRIQSLDEPGEREAAQNMLNLISEAQIKYCG